jgi:hypothetical protein
MNIYMLDTDKQKRGYYCPDKQYGLAPLVLISSSP